MPAAQRDSELVLLDTRVGHSPRSQSDRAYLRLRDLIVSLELAPGSVLEEPMLMQRLKVGRTPLREAVRRLAHEKLVQVLPSRGTFVSGIDITDLAAITEMRAQLEGFAAAMAAERATAAERERLSELRARLGGIEQLSPREQIDLDRAVHLAVHRAAHNQYLADTLQEHYNLSLRLWYLVLDRVDLGFAVGQHERLLDAIAERDAVAAQSVMREHVRAFESAVRRVV